MVQSPPPRDLLDTTFSDEQLAMVRNKYHLPDRYLFYPAQFWLHKNHLRLVEAFRLVADRFTDVHLVLTGMKANDYPRVMAKIAELSLTGRVLHLGYIDYEDMAGIYKLSAMLIMPTLFESVSMPVYEAFALKVPVCAANVVALPEQIGDAGVLFDPNEKRTLTIGFASGRFPFINVPYGIVPRNAVAASSWPWGAATSSTSASPRRSGCCCPTEKRHGT